MCDALYLCFVYNRSSFIVCDTMRKRECSTMCVHHMELIVSNWMIHICGRNNHIQNIASLHIRDYKHNDFMTMVFGFYYSEVFECGFPLKLKTILENVLCFAWQIIQTFEEKESLCSLSDNPAAEWRLKKPHIVFMNRKLFDEKRNEFIQGQNNRLRTNACTKWKTWNNEFVWYMCQCHLRSTLVMIEAWIAMSTIWKMLNEILYECTFRNYRSCNDDK